MAEQDNLVNKDQKLTPDLTGTKPGEPLFEYFRSNLPQDLTVEVYDKALSCRAFARLIVGKLGGPEKARAYSVEEEINPGLEDSEKTSHTYVVQINAPLSSRAFNSKARENRTVDYVLKNGKDNTSQLFSMPWNQL